MHCPCCQTSTFKRTRLDEDLAGHTCETCEGQWISSYDYWHWLEWQPNNREIKQGNPVDLNDTLKLSGNRRASFCPECNHWMRRAKVGHGLTFYIDRCSHCGGSWFNKGEWEVLKAYNIHDKVHLVFSEPWQSQIRQAEFNRVLDETYRSALGDEDYAQALRIRAWLEQHPHRDYILSVLNQVSPAGDESRYIPVRKPHKTHRAIPQNDLPKEELTHHVAHSYGGPSHLYDAPQPAITQS